MVAPFNQTTSMTQDLIKKWTFESFAFPRILFGKKAQKLLLLDLITKSFGLSQILFFLSKKAHKHSLLNSSFSHSKGLEKILCYHVQYFYYFLWGCMEVTIAILVLVFRNMIYINLIIY